MAKRMVRRPREEERGLRLREPLGAEDGESAVVPPSVSLCYWQAAARATDQRGLVLGREVEGVLVRALAVPAGACFGLTSDADGSVWQEAASGTCQEGQGVG